MGGIALLCSKVCHQITYWICHFKNDVQNGHRKKIYYILHTLKSGIYLTEISICFNWIWSKQNNYFFLFCVLFFRITWTLLLHIQWHTKQKYFKMAIEKRSSLDTSDQTWDLAYVFQKSFPFKHLLKEINLWCILPCLMTKADLSNWT